MTWVLIIFLFGTNNIVVKENGFRSWEHCENRAQAYMKNLDSYKYKHACIRERK